MFFCLKERFLFFSLLKWDGMNHSFYLNECWFRKLNSSVGNSLLSSFSLFSPSYSFTLLSLCTKIEKSQIFNLWENGVEIS